MILKYRTLFLPVFLTFIAFMTLVLLGFWQIERMGSKNRLMARVEESLAGAPSPIPSENIWVNFDSKSHDYTRVTVTGSFLHEKEAHLFTVLSVGVRGDTVPGYSILTPMVLESGAVVIINRGFVPADHKSASTRKIGQIEGIITLAGVLRAPEGQGLFVPDNNLAKNEWYTRDPAAIAKAYQLERVAPFIVEADATQVPGGLPSGGHTIVSFTNNHLQYAITWFSLSLVLLAVFGVWAKRRIASDNG